MDLGINIINIKNYEHFLNYLKKDFCDQLRYEL